MPERDMLMRVICDTAPAADPAGWRQREIRILRVALACGLETLDRLLVLKEEIPDGQLEWLADNRRRQGRNQAEPLGGIREGEADGPAGEA